MKYDEFIAQVQRRADLSSRDEADRTVCATFETLAERLAGGEAKDLASQLPPEIAVYLDSPSQEPVRAIHWTNFFNA